MSKDNQTISMEENDSCIRIEVRLTKKDLNDLYNKLEILDALGEQFTFGYNSYPNKSQLILLFRRKPDPVENDWLEIFNAIIIFVLKGFFFLWVFTIYLVGCLDF
ncbi:hypothetical protein [Lihuaxuella thermophila]|uniref:Uncharacterized protein n=1 Tax=Lihuaxuella thermophila TaxID=1173111 RepID=A0A1H8JKN0_9BACL|nr:hypothetical protein [Lihuaxuella thermophila]SEN81239.1 hypothetical protein SAMN05444955_1289 [Lihuaxuella thermophila]